MSLSTTPARQRGELARFCARIVTQDEPKSVALYYSTGSDFSKVPMERRAPYEYGCQVRGGGAKHFTYYIAVDNEQGVRAYPADTPTNEITAFIKHMPHQTLFDAEHNSVASQIIRIDGPVQVEPIGGEHPCLRFSAKQFNDKAAGGARLRVFSGFDPKTARPDGVLVVRARSLFAQTSGFELGLVESDDAAHGTEVPLRMTWRNIRIPLKKLPPIWQTKTKDVRLEKVSSLSLIFGAWLYARDATKPHGFEVDSIRLERPPVSWDLELEASDAPYAMFDAESSQFSIQTGLRYTRRLVGGMNDDSVALQIDMPDGFGPPPSALGFWVTLDSNLRIPDTDAAEWAMIVRARAMETNTPAVEVVLEEDDAAPWGANVPLTPEWREITIPLTQLVYFKHWNSLPKSRGGNNDHLKLDKLAAINICFGAWQCPGHEKEPHGIEIQSITLTRLRK